MKDTIRQLEDFYKLVLVAPAMIGLGIVVLSGLVIFAMDSKIIKDNYK